MFRITDVVSTAHHQYTDVFRHVADGRALLGASSMKWNGDVTNWRYFTLPRHSFSPTRSLRTCSCMPILRTCSSICSVCCYVRSPLEDATNLSGFVFYLFTGFRSNGAPPVRQIHRAELPGPTRSLYIIRVGCLAYLRLLAGLDAFPQSDHPAALPHTDESQIFRAHLRGIELFMGFGGVGSGVAHFAHVGGEQYLDSC